MHVVVAIHLGRALQGMAPCAVRQAAPWGYFMLRSNRIPFFVVLLSLFNPGMPNSQGVRKERGKRVHEVRCEEPLITGDSFSALVSFAPRVSPRWYSKAPESRPESLSLFTRSQSPTSLKVSRKRL